MGVESESEERKRLRAALGALEMMLEYAQAEAEERNVPTLVFLLKTAREELKLVLESLGEQSDAGPCSV